jgi:hypothetical protein
MSRYRHLVEIDGASRLNHLYDGPDAADAMAAWSKAISEGIPYVTLESLLLTESAVSHPEGGS